MSADKYLGKSKWYYLTGALFIIVGLLSLMIYFSLLDYAIIGIGIVLVVLGVNETLKSI